MEKSKETKGKAEAIRRFLKLHQPKLPEARGFLQFILHKPELMARLSIVNDLSDQPNAILVSAKGSGGYPFLYRRGHRLIHRTSQAVVDLMKFVPEQLALRLYTEPAAYEPGDDPLLDQLRRWSEELFNEEIERLGRRHALMAEIDAALDRKERDTFNRLAAELRRLS